MTDSNNTPTENQENAVQGRVDSVIADMAAGRVVPRNLDRIERSVTDARRDQSVGRAIGR